LQSQSWDDFQDWNPDVVITLCDSAAGETCPVWMQTATRIHWGLSDPSKLETEQEQSQAFQAVIKILESRVKRLSQMDLSVIDQPLIDTIAAMGQETN